MITKTLVKEPLRCKQCGKYHSKYRQYRMMEGIEIISDMVLELIPDEHKCSCPVWVKK